MSHSITPPVAQCNRNPEQSPEPRPIAAILSDLADCPMIATRNDIAATDMLRAAIESGAVDAVRHLTMPGGVDLGWQLHLAHDIAGDRVAAGGWRFVGEWMRTFERAMRCHTVYPLMLFLDGYCAMEAHESQKSEAQA